MEMIVSYINREWERSLGKSAAAPCGMSGKAAAGSGMCGQAGEELSLH